MLSEIYVVNESGQMEINFQALELIIGSKAVSYIKDDIAVGYRVLLIDSLGSGETDIFTYNDFTGNTIHYHCFPGNNFQFSYIYNDQKEILMKAWSKK